MAIFNCYLYVHQRGGIFQEKLKMIFEGNADVSPTVWCSGMPQMHPEAVPLGGWRLKAVEA